MKRQELTIETRSGNLYDFPHYYDLVFGSDWKAEYDFLLACFRKHAGVAVRRVFEPACGTGRLLYRLRKAGFCVSGLDLNRKAVKYCNERLARRQFEPTAFVGDMCKFRLPRRVEAAFNMINSFRHLTSRQQAESHLKCMAGALRRGAIYVLGLHLTPTVGQPLEEESWSARRGHLVVNTHMWLAERNRRRREERYHMTFDVYTPTRRFRLVDKIVFRTYTARQLFSLLSRVPELELIETYDFSYKIGCPIVIRPDSEDVVLVLRRR